MLAKIEIQAVVHKEISGRTELGGAASGGLCWHYQPATMPSKLLLTALLTARISRESAPSRRKICFQVLTLLSPSCSTPDCVLRYVGKGLPGSKQTL